MIVGYLDAGTGSLILQTVLGGAAGLAVFFKTAGRRFLPFRSKSEEAAPEQETGPQVNTEPQSDTDAVAERPREEVTES